MPYAVAFPLFSARFLRPARSVPFLPPNYASSSACPFAWFPFVTYPVTAVQRLPFPFSAAPLFCALPHYLPAKTSILPGLFRLYNTTATTQNDGIPLLTPFACCLTVCLHRAPVRFITAAVSTLHLHLSTPHLHARAITLRVAVSFGARACLPLRVTRRTRCLRGAAAFCGFVADAGLTGCLHCMLLAFALPLRYPNALPCWPADNAYLYVGRIVPFCYLVPLVNCYLLNCAYCGLLPVRYTIPWSAPPLRSPSERVCGLNGCFFVPYPFRWVDMLLLRFCTASWHARYVNI